MPSSLSGVARFKIKLWFSSQRKVLLITTMSLTIAYCQQRSLACQLCSRLVLCNTAFKLQSRSDMQTPHKTNHALLNLSLSTSTPLMEAQVLGNSAPNLKMILVVFGLNYTWRVIVSMRTTNTLLMKKPLSEVTSTLARSLINGIDNGITTAEKLTDWAKAALLDQCTACNGSDIVSLYNPPDEPIVLACDLLALVNQTIQHA